MKVKELNFSYDDLLTVLNLKHTIKIVEYKLKEAGYMKSIDKADKEGVSASAISQRVKNHPEKYDTVDFAGCLYVKEIKK
jgi:hypothetical protein